MILVPVELVGDYMFNLNVLKEVNVTEDFLELNEEHRGCSKTEKMDCITEGFKENILEKCRCLPFKLRPSQSYVSFL